jgi:cob(I)alamin adenosyltransferase
MRHAKAEPMTRNGYLHVYTGNGDAHTMAALGLALRAAGAGMRVFIGQFLTYGPSSEATALARWQDHIQIEQFACRPQIGGRPSTADLGAARRGLERVEAVLAANTCHLVILDEANRAVSLGLFSLSALLNLIAKRPTHTEVVITGADARPELVAQADLVTEMKTSQTGCHQGVFTKIGNQ